MDENNYIEYPSDYTPVVEYEEPVVVEAAPTNEEIVDAYVEAMAEEVYQEDETQYTK